MEKNKKKGKMGMRPVKKVGGSGTFIIWLLVAFGILYLFNRLNQAIEKPIKEIPYSGFFTMLKNNPENQIIKSCVKTDSIVKGELSDGSGFVVNIPENDQDLIRLLRENVREFDIRPPKTLMINILYSIGPMLLFILFLWLFV